MYGKLENTAQNAQDNNADQNTGGQENPFQIIISELEIDQDILDAINVLSVQESNSSTETLSLQLPQTLQPGEVLSESVAFTVTEADLNKVSQQLSASFKVDLPPEMPKVPEVNCVFCHEVIKPGELSVACRNGHPHHKECWDYNGGQCGVHGCGARQCKVFDVTQLAVEDSSVKLNDSNGDANVIMQLLREILS